MLLCSGYPTGAYDAGAPVADQVVVETRDVSNFLRAREIARTSDDPAGVYRNEYFARGTIGLDDMLRMRIGSVERFTAAVRQYPDAHDVLAQIPGYRATLVDKIRRIYARFRDLYPPVKLPPVYFVVSGMSTGGTVSDNGLLIGTEAVIRAFGSIDALAPVVAHELVHYQQANAEGRDQYASVGGDAKTLLGQAVNEGAADFVGELVAGEHMNASAHAYGLANEAELWREFEAVMLDDELVPWMNGQSSTGAWAERPRDLGYFIGYRIVESFYTNATDKRAAIATILDVSDPQAFLEASGYAQTVHR